MHPYVKAVKEYAVAHYNDEGWDYIVETYEDQEILDDVASAANEREAIEIMREIALLLHDRRMDAMMEIF